MNKIKKFLNKLPKEERGKILSVLYAIRSGNLSGLDIKKLKGTSKRYRVRVGAHRIQFEMDKGIISILDVNKRDDNTYNF